MRSPDIYIYMYVYIECVCFPLYIYTHVDIYIYMYIYIYTYVYMPNFWAWDGLGIRVPHVFEEHEIERDFSHVPTIGVYCIRVYCIKPQPETKQMNPLMNLDRFRVSVVVVLLK